MVDNTKDVINALVTRVSEAYNVANTREYLLIQLIKEVGKLARLTQQSQAGVPQDESYIGKTIRDIVIAGLTLADIEGADLGQLIVDYLTSKEE